MSDNQALSLATRVAHAFHEDHLYFDRLLYADLLGKMRYTGLLALAVGGRELTKDECLLLDDLAVIITVADPRIWPLKLVRVISAYGAIYPAQAAGNLSMEQAWIGNSACGRAATMIEDMRRTLGEREHELPAIEAEVERRFKSLVPPVGYGVPFRTHDERVVALTKRLGEVGRTHLPNWAFFERLSTVIRAKKNAMPNVGSAFGAACMDLGFSAASVGPLALGLVQNAFLANAIEGAGQAPAILRSLPQSAVEYRGKPPRESPRAEASRSRKRLQVPK
jgi:hypothetical protein